jgi:hypothetical protein
MTSTILRVLCVALTVTGSACGDGDGSNPAGPSRSSPGSTFLDLRSDPGDYIGAGESHRYTLTDSVWQTRVDVGVLEPNHVWVSLRPVDNTLRWWWTFDVSAPTGQSLKVGTYENARRWPFQGAQPGLSFSGTGRGCNMLTGAFVIRAIQIGPGNTLERFHATFEQHCEGSSAALRGEINVLANPWR